MSPSKITTLPLDADWLVCFSSRFGLVRVVRTAAVPAAADERFWISEHVIIGL